DSAHAVGHLAGGRRTVSHAVPQGGARALPGKPWNSGAVVPGSHRTGCPRPAAKGVRNVPTDGGGDGCMSASLAVERVRAALREKGVDTEIVEFAQSTRTAQEAADAIGTSVAQIVKSLVFVAGGRPFLAL